MYREFTIWDYINLFLLGVNLVVAVFGIVVIFQSKKMIKEQKEYLNRKPF